MGTLDVLPFPRPLSLRPDKTISDAVCEEWKVQLLNEPKYRTEISIVQIQKISV
jgi:hypothetical protein